MYGLLEVLVPGYASRVGISARPRQSSQPDPRQPRRPRTRRDRACQPSPVGCAGSRDPCSCGGTSPARHRDTDNAHRPRRRRFPGRRTVLAEVGDVRRHGNRHKFARANGTAPIPANSGRSQRCRLNPGGNRQLNRALHAIALTQIRCHPDARAYYERNAREQDRRGALRCLKRRPSDVAYRQLQADARVALTWSSTRGSRSSTRSMSPMQGSPDVWDRGRICPRLGLGSAC